MIALLATVLLLGAQAPEPPSLPIAVTKSGLHVQCTVDTHVGDRSILTPFGKLLVATDPVAEIKDGSRQLQDLDSLHRQGLIDDETWLRDLSTAGQLEALERNAAKLVEESPQLLYPYELLEAWGHRLDAVPDKVRYEDRVAWLWDAAMDATPVRTLMYGARLHDEISTSELAQSDRRLVISKLRKGLRSRVGARRRVAALIAGRQQEFSLRETLLLASLRDPEEVARDAAAIATNEVDPREARQYWVRNLSNGREGDRELAARNLGRYGGKEAIRALIYVLSAWERPSLKRYEFDTRSIWPVTTVDKGAIGSLNPTFVPSVAPSSQECGSPSGGSGYQQALADEQEFLDRGTTLRVGKYGEGLYTAILEALDGTVGERTGRSQEEWLHWFEETWQPAHS